MIEKLPFEITQGEYEGKKFDIKNHTSPFDMQVKINELVDAVNGLQAQVAILEEHAHPTAKVYEETQNMYDNAILDALKDKQVDVVVEPADQYAEQRKWIGCLCELWSGNSKNHRYGIWKGIAKNTYKGHKKIHKYQALSMSFEHCEPVKQDDDIIFKGK